MNELNFNNVEEIDFSTTEGLVPENQQQREYDLQTRAGEELSNDFIGVRTRLAEEQEEEAMNNLYQAAESALGDGVAASGVVEFVQKYRPAVTADDLDISLEAAAGQKEIEAAFIDNQHVALNNAADGVDPTDDMIKAEQFTTFMQSMRDYADTFTTWQKAKGFVRTMIDPQFHQNLVEQGYLPDEATPGFNLTQEAYGEAVNKYFVDNWNKLSPRDYQTFLDSVESHIKQSDVNPWMLNELLDVMDHGSNMWSDVLGTVEVAAPFIGFALKTPAQAAKRAGNIKLLNQEAIKTLQSGNKDELVKEFMTPTITKPVANIKEVASDSRVAEQLAIGTGREEAEAVVKAAQVRGIYDEEELSVLADIAKTKYKKIYGKSSLDPVDVVATELDTGEVRVSALLGNNKGEAMTKKKCVELAKKLELDHKEYTIIKKDNEGYFINLNKTVGGFDAMNKQWKFMIGGKDVTSEWSVKGALASPVNWLIKHFGGSYKIGTEAHARAVESDRITQGLISKMNKEYKVSFNKLSKEDTQSINELFLKGQRANEGRGAWFTPEDLDRMGVNDNVRKAYYDFKKASDIEYLANNADKRAVLVRNNFKMYGDVIGKRVTRNSLDPNTSVLMDINGNPVQLSNLADDDVVVQVNRLWANRTNMDCTHIVGKANVLKERDLPHFVTNYMPGGRRQYMRGTAFVKVGRGFFNTNTNKMLHGFSKTLTAGTDIKALKQYADEVNKAIGIWKTYKGRAAAGAKELNATDFKYFKVDNWGDLESLMKTKENPQGLIDPDYTAQVLESGQRYNYGTELESLADDMSDADWAVQELIDNRMKFNRHRGNLLDDVNGNPARLVDLDEIYDKTINKAAYSLGKGDLVHWYGKELERYSKVIDNWDDIKNLGDYDKLNRAQVILKGRDVLSEGDRQLLRAAERYIDHSRRILNAKTKGDVVLENTMTRTAQFVDAFLPKAYQRGEVFEKIAKANPSKIARALGFNYVMGWWNPAQLVKQGLGVASVAAMEPINAAKGMLLYPLVRLSRGVADKGILKAYRKAAQKLTGISDEEFEGLLKFVDRYGSESASGLLVGADREYGAALLRDKNILKRAWDTQYIFMREGNAANFYIADIAAYLSKSKKGVKNFKDIAAYSDDLFINMTKSSESAFQHGQYSPTAALAQWLSYPMRMVEAMGNGRLTKAQRISLLSSQLAMWGVAGTLGTKETELNMYTSLREHGLDDKTSNIITNGLLSTIAKEAGIDFDEGLSLGEQLGSVVNLYKLLTGEDGEMSIPAGRAPAQWFALAGAIKEMVLPETGDYDFYRYMKYIATTKDLPSSMRNLSKGLLAFEFQKFYDNNQHVIKDDVQFHQALAQLLGFGPYERQQNSYMYEALLKEDETIQAAFEDVKVYNDAIRFYNIEDSKDPDKFKKLEELYKRREMVVKAYVHALRDAYPDGRALTKFNRLCVDDLFGLEENTTDKRTEKTIKNIGLPQTYLIKRIAEEKLNGSNE